MVSGLGMKITDFGVQGVQEGMAMCLAINVIYFLMKPFDNKDL